LIPLVIPAGLISGHPTAKNQNVVATLKPSPLAVRARYVFDQVRTSARFTSALLLTILILELAILFLRASRKPFFYDELVTLHVSKLHPFSVLYKALLLGVDGMTPGYYALARLASRLPGDPQITLRLPSILGYILTLLGVYWFARRRMPAIAGLVAVFLITLSPFREISLHARCYSLLVGFLSISAAIWQRIDQKRFMTPLFALFLTLAVSSHHFAVAAISAFGAAELTWTILSYRIRWRVWLCYMLAFCPLLWDLPLILHFRELVGNHFWSPTRWSMAFTTYAECIGINWKLALALVVFFGMTIGQFLLRILVRLREQILEPDFWLPEIVLVGGLLFYPALLVAITKLVGNSGYTPRYGLPAILGLVLGSVYLARAIWLKSCSIYVLVALLIVFALNEIADLHILYKTRSTRLNERWTNLVGPSHDKDRVPIVIADGMRYIEAATYAPAELRDRLVTVVDEHTAARLIGWDTVDQENLILAKFVPLRVKELAPFLAANPRFLLYSGGDADWFTEYLVHSKYDLSLLLIDSGGSLYIVER
jgi:Dolichyl-phosphate-mannose-protein mannosyltransferase